MNSDFNYQRNVADGTCIKVPGLEERPWDAVCKTDPDRVDYYKPTGYRKIPLSTCHGGRELEFVGTAYPCPGKEEEFEHKHRTSGIALFFAIVTPIAVAMAAGYYVYSRWDGKFGRIRLGDTGATGREGFFSADQPWIKWPVTIVAGLVALVAATPLVVGTVWRSVQARFGGSGFYGGQRYTSRGSFARSRGEYVAVEDDEGELLGDDSDEDV